MNSRFRTSMTTAIAATLTAAVLLAGGCRSSNPSTSQERRQVEQLRTLPVSDQTVDTVTEVLREAAVEIDPDDAQVTGGRPISVTQWQVRNLAVEAANGGGVSGDELASLAPLPRNAPPLPYLIAAWAQTYDSSGARFARELMALPVDGSTMFPNLVLTLFLADASSATAPSGAAMVLKGNAAGGPCTIAANAIQRAIASAATALKANQGSGLLGFLSRIWNRAVDLAAAALTGLVDTIERPVVSLVADAFGVVAVIVQVSSFLTQWRAELRADPSHTRFGIDSEQVTGQFILSVTQEQLPIPEFVLDCADSVNVDLRTIASAAGSTVDWTAAPAAGLAQRLSADKVLAADKTARYKYQTSQESAHLAQSPQTESLAMFVAASIGRNDVRKVRDLFTKLLFDQIPAYLRGVVEQLARPLLAQADSKLRAISDVRARAATYITFHKAPPATPGSGSESVPPVRATAIIPDSCPDKAVAKFGYGQPAPFKTKGILWSCGYVGPSALQLVVGATETLSQSPGPDEINVQVVNIPGTVAAWLSGLDDAALGPDWGVHVVVGNKTLTVAGGERKERIVEIAKTILSVS